MSLINQALKKEQQRRSLNLQSPSHEIPSYESEPLTANQVVRRDQGRNPLPLLIGFASLGLFLLVCGGAAVYFGKSYLSDLQPGQSVAAKGSDSEPSEAPVATANPVASALEAKAANAEAVETIIEAAPEANVAEGTAEEPAAASVEAPVTEAPVAEAPVKEGPKFNLEAQAHIDELQVHGYRSAGANSRLLMSGRVYKIGDVVNHAFALRFRGAENGSLVFEDANGFRYEKPL